jgi:hypothetical protein
VFIKKDFRGSQVLFSKKTQEMTELAFGGVVRAIGCSTTVA